MGSNQKKHNCPPYDDEYGFWYPLVCRILYLENWWPPSKYLGKPRRTVDIYIGVWWLFQLIFAIVLSTLHIPNWLLICIFLLFAFRLFDIILVLLATLVVGYHRSPSSWASTNRTVFLVIMNSFEVLIIFSIFYFCLSVFGVEYTDKIKSFLDAAYFSVVTGTTLGYGEIYPESSFGKILAILQPIVLVFIVINMLSYARGSYINESNDN